VGAPFARPCLERDKRKRLQAFPGGEGKWQISFQGGGGPHWGRSGDRLYYSETASRLMEVEVTTRPSLAFGTPRPVFSLEGAAGPDLLRGFDVAPDGKRFVMVQNAGGPGSGMTAITVVENWFAEFQGRRSE
jgi:hypothetical protein